MGFLYGPKLGEHCHWCGAFVRDDGRVKAGNHVFCRNGRKCQMAHARAYRKYKARVIPGPPAAGTPGSCSSSKGNARKRRPTAPSSGAIRRDRAKEGNGKKP